MTGMAIVKAGAVLSAVGAGMAAQISPITEGEKLGQMTAQSVLGVVCVACVVAVVMLYRDQRKDREDDAEREKATTAALQRVADVIEKCQKSGGRI